MALIRRPTPLGELISLRNALTRAALARAAMTKQRKIQIPKAGQPKP